MLSGYLLEVPPRGVTWVVPLHESLRMCGGGKLLGCAIGVIFWKVSLGGLF